MIELNEQQRQQLAGGAAIDVTDPDTSIPYVLMRKDVYDRVKQWLFDDSDWTEEEMRQALARASAANGWDEPGMDAYDRYDEERSKRCP